MEFPDRFVNGERLLAALLIVPVLAAAGLEAGSWVAGRIRKGQPVAVWVSVKTDSHTLPQQFLALARPRQRTLDLIHVPETLVFEDKRTIAKLHAEAAKQGSASDSERAFAVSGGLLSQLAQEAPESLLRSFADQPLLLVQGGAWDDLPPLEARRWLLDRLHPLRLVRQSILAAEGWSAFDRLRLYLEISALGPDSIRAAFIPETRAEREAFFAGLAEASVEAPHPDERATTVEVLNSTDKKGVASAVTKVLRSRGADVMSTGNAPARPRTLIVDRMGRPELAFQVERMLGCGSAEVVTQIDAKRLVDVSVIVAGDCLAREQE